MKRIMLFTATLLFIGGCGSTSHRNKNKDINMVDYMPLSDTTKKFFTTKYNGDTKFYEESITVASNKINIKKDDLLNRTLTINETDIVEDDIDTNLSKVLKKYINEGDTLYTLPKITKVEDIKFKETIFGTKKIESTKTCKLEKKLTKLEDYDIKYYNNILKFKCIEDKKIVTHVKDDLPDYIHLTNGEEKSDYDISYLYIKKDIGLIVKINDDCIVKDKEVTIINDSSKTCDEEHYSHTFFLE